MTKIPVANSDRKRRALKEADLLLRNRWPEKNPALSDEGPAYVQRPPLRYWQTVGTGPIRATYQSPGAFEDDMFVVSYNTLYRVASADGAVTTIFTGLQGGDENQAVKMTATGDIGTIGPRLFIADGRALYVYMENGFATGTFTATAIADGDVVRLGSVYYRFSTASLDTGAPAGTVGNPWKVLIGGTILESYTNLYLAINDTGINGTDYSTALVENPDAQATVATASGVIARAKAEGVAGNGVVTTETGANMAWGAGTLQDGGDPGVVQVVTPEEVGVLDVTNMNNFVIVVPAQGEGINGRFYWIQPGEIIIDPLDFATAERSTDPIYQCVVFNDAFWLPGQSSTEVWYMTGDPDAPMQRQQGVTFDRGVIPGGALQVKDSMMLIDPDGAVVQYQGGEKVISTPDIAERLRKAIAYANIAAL